MKNLLILIAVLALAGGIGYVVFFRWGDANRAAKGFKKADSPQVCAEMFRKAIKEREYEIASDYVTAAYAEQLKKVHEEAKSLGESIDNLESQINSRGLMRDEMQLVLFSLDPFPKNIEMVTSDETTSTPKATMTITLPKVGNSQANNGLWNIRNDILLGLVPTLGRDRTLRSNKIMFNMKKEGEVWKLDIPVDSTLQSSVTVLKDKYKNFVNPIDDVKGNLKIDATTKENVSSELKRLLEQASKE